MADMPMQGAMPQGGGQPMPEGGGMEQFKMMLRKMPPATLQTIKAEVDMAVAEAGQGGAPAPGGQAPMPQGGGMDWLFQ